MTMTGTKTAPKALSVSEAAQRAEAARKHLDDLTDRLLNGDASVTSDEIDTARREAEHSDLLVKGAKTRERREAEEQLRADVEHFAANYPTRLVKPFSELAAYRAKALAAIRDYLEVCDAVESERASAIREHASLRPDSVAPNEPLPDWYVDADPAKDTRVPQVDAFRAAFSVAREAVAARQVGKGKWHESEAGVLRAVDAHVSGQEPRIEHARKLLNEGN